MRRFFAIAVTSFAALVVLALFVRRELDRDLSLTWKGDFFDE